MELKIHPDDKNKKEQVALLSFLMVNLKLRERLIGRPQNVTALLFSQILKMWTMPHTGAVRTEGRGKPGYQ